HAARAKAIRKNPANDKMTPITDTDATSSKVWTGVVKARTDWCFMPPQQAISRGSNSNASVMGCACLVGVSWRDGGK
ncbi:hypothetical protein KEM55_004496, partial [Ascosphaera atra]